MAEWSKDPALEQVFSGDPPIDMHAMTGVGVFNKANNENLTYEQFLALLANPEHPQYSLAKTARAKGKATNFGGQYRIAAPKLATMLFVSEQEAQAFLDAKAEAFPVAEEWSQEQMELVKQTGTVKTLLGAIRHLNNEVKSPDFSTAGKAERQGISFRIQGSAAEMTKKAEGRLWKARIEKKFDCQVMFSVHDEIVISVVITDLVPCTQLAHACMVENYANMRLPIKSSISMGWSFGEQVELNSLPTEEAILDLVAKLQAQKVSTT